MSLDSWGNARNYKVGAHVNFMFCEDKERQKENGCLFGAFNLLAPGTSGSQD